MNTYKDLLIFSKRIAERIAQKLFQMAYYHGVGQEDSVEGTE